MYRIKEIINAPGRFPDNLRPRPDGYSEKIMSTRCNVIVKEGKSKIYLYHHHDGYPEGVGMFLKNFLQGVKFWYNDIIATDLVKLADDEYGISNGVHEDIEFLYVIDCRKKTLKCYQRKDWNVIGKDLLRDDFEVEIKPFEKK